MGIMKIKLKILALGAVMAVGGVNGVCSVNGVCGESGVCSVSGVWGESGVGSAETLRGEGEQSPQRASRKRPGAMRHTEAEVENARRVTAVKAKYIHDNAQFKGAAYMTGDAGASRWAMWRSLLPAASTLLSLYPPRSTCVRHPRAETDAGRA